MSAAAVAVGGTYLARVSGRVVPVRVLEIISGHREIRQGRSYWWVPRTHWRCRSEVTGREILVKSAQRFRGPAAAPAPGAPR